MLLFIFVSYFHILQNIELIILVYFVNFFSYTSFCKAAKLSKNPFLMKNMRNEHHGDQQLSFTLYRSHFTDVDTIVLQKVFANSITLTSLQKQSVLKLERLELALTIARFLRRELNHFIAQECESLLQPNELFNIIFIFLNFVLVKNCPREVISSHGLIPYKKCTNRIISNNIWWSHRIKTQQKDFVPNYATYTNIYMHIAIYCTVQNAVSLSRLMQLFNFVGSTHLSTASLLSIASVEFLLVTLCWPDGRNKRNAFKQNERNVSTVLNFESRNMLILHCVCIYNVHSQN